MLRIMLIAPYEGLLSIAKKISIEEGVKLDTTLADLNKGVIAAKKAELDGYDVIISRGETATLIQEAVSTPVISISIDGFGVLKIFKLVQGIEGKVALVGFPNITSGVETICKILDFKIKYTPIDSVQNVEHTLKELRAKGFKTVIGDVITVKKANRMGMSGFLITSGEESLRLAIEESIRISKALKSANEQKELYKAIFQSMRTPAIILDNSNKVIEKNIQSKDIVSIEELLNHTDFRAILDGNSESNPNILHVLNTSNNKFEFTLHQLKETSFFKLVLIHSSTEIDEEPPFFFNNENYIYPILGQSKEANKQRNIIKRFSQNNKNIVLYGPKGVGKKSLIYMIHKEKYNTEEQIITIDFTNITHSDINQIDDMVRLQDKGTILLENIVNLNYNLLGRIERFINSLNLEFRIVTIIESSPQEFKDFFIFTDFLSEFVFEEEIELLPLESRKVDIKNYINYFLTELHVKNGHQVLGIKDDAVEYLMRKIWPENLVDLRKVIREATLHSNSYYLEVSDFEFLFDEKVNKYEVDISQPLEKIEFQVIEKVLNEENFNQSAAAKRLGINRTTLWRKLNR